ncbi:cytochrome P460 family protein [Halovulum sp. GXIMD14793]
MKTIAATFALTLLAGVAQAQECSNDTDPYDIDAAGVDALYACIEAKMLAGYTKKDHAVAQEYRNWTVTATRPAVPGPHGERFLLTFANDIAAEQYIKFEEEGVVMPVGSILVKESFKMRKGEAKVGPLFIMTKVAEGEAPETNDWVYDAVQPNGKPMGIKQSFCHDCHAAYEDQDYLGYPAEEVRVSN